MIERIDKVWLKLINISGTTLKGLGMSKLMEYRHNWWTKRRVWNDKEKKWAKRV